MRYELYELDLEVTKSKNKELFMACINHEADADKLVDEYVRANSDIYNYPEKEFDNLEDAKSEMNDTTWQYRPSTIPYILISYSLVLEIDEDSEQIAEAHYSKC